MRTFECRLPFLSHLSPKNKFQNICSVELSYNSNIFHLAYLNFKNTPWNTHLRIQNILYTVNTTIHCEEWPAEPETLWQMISCFIKHNCVHRSTKRNKKWNSENISFENSHTVILKMWRRVNIKIQNSTIMGITIMKSSQKTYKMKDLVALSWR